MGTLNRFASSTGLIGRDQERQWLTEAINAAAGGCASLVMVLGDPAVGITSLIEASVDDTQLLAVRLQGWEGERSNPLAALDRLYEEVATYHRQPERGNGSNGPALAAMLTAASSSEPLICVVEDAQWVDRQSLQALCDAATLTSDQAVAVVLSMRASFRPSIEADAVSRELRLEPLADDDAASVLKGFDPRPVTTAVSELILEAADGYPGLLASVSRTLTDAQLTGRQPIQLPLPASPELQSALRDDATDLPAQAQWFLAAASACRAVDLQTAVRASRRRGLTQDDLAVLERRGHVRSVNSRVDRCRVGVGSAIYYGMAPQERRGLHRALADAFPTRKSAERAIHRAGSVVGPDLRVVQELSTVAEDALAAGQLTDSADAFLRAAGYIPERDGRARLLLRAVGSLLANGDADKALSTISDALELAVSPALRARLQQLQAQMHWSAGRISAAVGALCVTLDEANTQGSPWARDVALQASLFAWCGVSRATHEQLRTAIDKTFKDEHELTIAGAAVLRATLVIGDGISGPAGNVAKAAVESAVPTGVAWEYTRGLCALAAWEFDTASSIFRDTLARDWREGAWVVASVGNQCLAWSEHNAGRFSQAETAARNGLAAALKTQNTTVEITHRLALQRAHNARGIEHPDERLAALLAKRTVAFEHAVADVALGELALARGDYPGSVQHLRAAVARYRTHLEVVMHPRYDLVEALARSGDRAGASQELDELKRRSQDLTASLHLARLWRCDGLVMEGSESLEALERSIDLHQRSTNAFEYARTQLCIGEVLRRSRKKGAAREYLRSAAEIFDELEAPEWKTKALAELEVSGLRARQRTPDTLDDLTIQEHRVASIVAHGATNQQAATELGLSRKTVEQHLGSIYRKLGLRRRADLVRAYAMTAEASGSHPPTAE